MKKSIVILILCAVSFSAAAQSSLPTWVNQIPKPENDTYYFRVTHAEEESYEKAYVRAFSMAILESSWKIGLPVDAKNDMAAIEHGVEDNLSIRSHQSNLAMNKVCEYKTRSIASGKIELYVLWQVAVAGNITPDFGYFNKCN